MTVKKVIGFLHLWLGLLSGLVIFVVALSGSILVFEKEVDEWVNKDFYFTQVPSSPLRLTIDSLLKNVRAYDSELKIKDVVVNQKSINRTVLISGEKNKEKHVVAIDPYTGKIIRSINHEGRFFTIVLHLHRHLLSKDYGKAITGASCLIFVVLLISGLVLWWPKKLRLLKQRLTIKWKASAKRVNWDLHSVLGFYVHPALLLIALTGLTWSYQWYNNGLFLLLDGKPQKKYEVPANTVQQPIADGFYEKLYQDASNRLPYKGKLTIAFPKSDSLAFSISKENYEARVTNVVDVLYYEKGTASLLKKRLYDNESLGMRVRRIVYPIHTGQIYGLPTKVLAFIVCLVAASLPITGLRIWLGRRKKKVVKKLDKKTKEVALPEAVY